MAAELRWILLGLSVILLAGIWWWGARRSRQAPGNADPRASFATPPEPDSFPEPLPGLSVESDSRPWGVPPFEPLSIRTADFEQIDIMDAPMTATPEPMEMLAHESDVDDEHASQVAAAGSSADSPSAGMPADAGPEGGPSSEHAVARESQRIVSIRVSAVGDVRWPGALLMAVLEKKGLEFGRYKVFHRKHTDGRTLFCAASRVEPGTFDIAKMPAEEFRGLTLFAVLPGPADALQTLDVMLATAQELAEILHGSVQDAGGSTLSVPDAEELREDVARFQASLAMS